MPRPVLLFWYVLSREHKKPFRDFTFILGKALTKQPIFVQTVLQDKQFLVFTNQTMHDRAALASIKQAILSTTYFWEWFGLFCDSIKGSGLPLDVLKLFSVQDTAQPSRGRTVWSCNTNLNRINGKPVQCKAFICWPYPFLLPDLCQVSSEPFRTFSKGLGCPECKQMERVWWGHRAQKDSLYRAQHSNSKISHLEIKWDGT